MLYACSRMPGKARRSARSSVLEPGVTLPCSCSSLAYSHVTYAHHKDIDIHVHVHSSHHRWRGSLTLTPINKIALLINLVIHFTGFMKEPFQLAIHSFKGKT